MTRRRILRSAGTLLAAAICATTVSLATPGSADAQSSETEPTAFEQLATCAQESKTLLVLLLMDESGSLRGTDPEGVRITAAQTALRQLARLHDRGVDTQVRLAGFGAGFTPYGEWTRATPESLPALEEAAGAFRQRTDEVDTDFHAALAGARNTLAFRAAQTSGASSPCRLLLLFTDGNYDIQPRTTAQQRERYGQIKDYAPDVPLTGPRNAARVVQLGRALVCERDGLADELRDGDVVTAAVALERDISEDHRQFLRGVAGAAGCGSESGSRFGAYVPASDTSELIAGFDRIGNEVGGGTSDEGDPYDRCPQSEICTDGGIEFTLDGTVADFHLLLHLDSPDVVAQLTAPDGERIVLPADRQSSRLAGAHLEVTRLSPVDVVVDATLPAGADDWAGRWQVVFFAPSGEADVSPQARLYLFGALAPHYLGDRDVRRGESAEIVAEIRGANDRPVTGEQFATQMSATVTDPASGRPEAIDLSGPDDDGRYRGSYTPADGAAAASVTLDLELTSTTPSGLTLQPRSQSVPITILPPAAYPRIQPTTLRLSSLSDDTLATGTLTVSGGEASGGCVWIASLSDVDLPRLSSGLTPSYDPPATHRDRCVSVAPGRSAQIDVEMDADAIAPGTGAATLHLRSVSDDDSDVIDTTVPVTFEMIDVIDQSKRVVLSLAILVPGILLPVFILWLLNWSGARFEPMGALKRARIPVRVGPDERIERTDGSPLTLHRGDFAGCDGQRPSRAVEFDDLTLRSRTPLWPFRMPFGVASDGSSPATGSDGTVHAGGQTVARVPFALARQWVFVLTDAAPGEDGGRPTATGVLHIFLPNGPIASQAPDVEDAIARSLPAQAHTIAEEEIARTSDSDESADEHGPEDEHQPSPDRGGGWKPPSGAPAANTPVPEPASTRPEPAPRSSGDGAAESEGWRPPPRR